MPDFVRPCVLVAARLSTGQAFAAEPVHLEQGDWLLQCDNTRRCSAVGYQAESGRERAALAAVRIAREAGPAAGFALAAERSDTMCRGFPDGAWELPVVVSRVLPPSSNSSFPNRKRAS